VAQTVAQVTFKIIGYFRGAQLQKSALPRQPHLSNQSGFIEFSSGFDHKLALHGLEDMSHCWLIFYLHRAQSKAKPLVKPPRAPNKLIGVYATRAPYRPNSIGLSLVQIEKIEKGKLFLKNCDLLDGSPLLDIKPYVQEADVALEPQQGWIDQAENWFFSLTNTVKEKVEWLKSSGFEDFENVLTAQLTTSPFQKGRKRLKSEKDGTAILSYRTWRFHMAIDNSKKHIHVLNLHSGYSKSELKDKRDPYKDKDLHRRFTKCFV
jgi:tRNA-Thr(GGU) m(6)t(6)A37 methyltransferase TsaA